jgi:hypothetical protein
MDDGLIDAMVSPPGVRGRATRDRSRARPDVDLLDRGPVDDVPHARYRERLGKDSDNIENLRRAGETGCLLVEDRTFMRV